MYVYRSTYFQLYLVEKINLNVVSNEIVNKAKILFKQYEKVQKN